MEAVFAIPEWLLEIVVLRDNAYYYTSSLLSVLDMLYLLNEQNMVAVAYLKRLSEKRDKIFLRNEMRIINLARALLAQMDAWAKCDLT